MMCTEDNDSKYFDLPTKWIYRGEGNCNIVISFPSLRKILRVRKVERPSSILRWIIILISDLLYWYCGKSFKDEVRDLKFYSLVMRPLIGHDYTSSADHILLPRKQVKILENELIKYRPEFRKHKGLQFGRAALFDDFTYLNTDLYDFLEFSRDTYSVEIKPKQGWMLPSEKVGGNCTFCVNQFRKKERNEISAISKYCPEDLFSGQDDKMKYAIMNLLEEPQNNFKIFKNGYLLYGEKNKQDLQDILSNIFDNYTVSFNNLQDEFCSFIQQCLVSRLYAKEYETKCIEPMCVKNVDTNQNLPKGCVLEKILSVQKLAKEGTKFYSKFTSRDQVDEWRYVSKLLNELEANKNMCLNCIVNTYNTQDVEGDFDADLAVVPYLLSAVAKDCSLMITFRKINTPVGEDMKQKNIFKTSYGYYLVSIGVFDLYPKPLSTVRKHIKRNKEIYGAFLRATKEE